MLKPMISVLALASMNALAASPICDKASSIDEAISCLQEEVSKAEAEMARYLDASKQLYAKKNLSITGIENSQKTWLDRRGSLCNFANILPRDMKKHTAEHLYCRWRITRERTYQVWSLYLSDSNGALPEMPE